MIGKNIAKYRKQQNISQKDFAQRLGVTQSRVSNWEHGTNSPDIEMLFEICNIFKIPINEIYGLEDSEYKFFQLCEWLSVAGFSIEEDLDSENDFYLINSDENGTVDSMQKQDLINLIDKIMKDGEDYKERYIVNSIKSYFLTK